MNYTPAGPSTKFSTMWHWTNIATHHNKGLSDKLSALDKMSTHFDDDTREHFRMALAQVLRDERSPVVRREAISLLASYFAWHEIEWTFWCHDLRCPKDSGVLDIYGRYCKRKSSHGNSEDNYEVVRTIIREIVAETTIS